MTALPNILVNLGRLIGLVGTIVLATLVSTSSTVHAFPECLNEKAVQDRLTACEKASKDGDSVVSNILGFVYLNGWSVDHDFQKAEEYFEISAENGYIPAWNNLGAMVLNNWILVDDPNRFKIAADYFRKALEYAPALNNLGVMVMNDWIQYPSSKNKYQVAEGYFSAGAEKGFAPAENNLGVMVVNDWIKVDPPSSKNKKAAEHFEAAVNGSYAPAQNNLGVMILKEEILGSAERAIELFRMSAEQGHVPALFNLGLSYAEGQGVVRNYKQAAEYFTKGAVQGDEESQYNLGLMYANGQGVEKDLETAYFWLQVAKHGGIGEAEEIQARVAVLLTPEQRNLAQALADQRILFSSLDPISKSARLFDRVASTPEIWNFYNAWNGAGVANWSGNWTSKYGK